MTQTWLWLAWLAVAYAVGSIPFGLLIGLARGVDIRSHGSGNVGATNCGRVLGRKWGILCFLLDVLKGFLPVLLYGLAVAGDELSDVSTTVAALKWIAIAAAAVLGHVFPVWLGFRGGKGVATGLGVLLGLWPVLTLPAIGVGLIWLLVTWATGYVSLASVVAAVSLPPLAAISAWAMGRDAGEGVVFVAVTALLAALVVWRHRTNLAKLRAGTESKAAWTQKRRRVAPPATPGEGETGAA